MIFHMTPREWRLSLPPGSPFFAKGWEAEGFHHFTAHVASLHRVDRRFYAGDPRPYDLLYVDEALLDVPVTWVPVETWAPPFPHVYGMIRLQAIVEVRPLLLGPGGMRVFPGGTSSWRRQEEEAQRGEDPRLLPGSGPPLQGGRWRREDGEILKINSKINALPSPPRGARSLSEEDILASATPLGLEAVLAEGAKRLGPRERLWVPLPCPPSADPHFAAANEALGREPNEMVVRLETEASVSPWFPRYWPEAESLRRCAASAGLVAATDPVPEVRGAPGFSFVRLRDPC